MKHRTHTTAVKGLINVPNEYGVYAAGACQICDNLVFRALNKPETATDVSSALAVGTAGGIVRHAAPLKSGKTLTIQESSSFWFAYCDDNFITPPLSVSGAIDWTNTYNASWIQSVQTRGRMLLNANTGVFLLDNLDPDSPSEFVFRRGGLPQPFITGALVAASSADESDGYAIPPKCCVAYCAVIARRWNGDDYEILSPPSPAIRFLESTEYVQWHVSIRWPLLEGSVQAGDVVQLYRSNGIDLTGETITDDSYRIDPASNFYLVAEAVLSAGDIAGGSIGITDSQLMRGPLFQTNGVPIYTDGSQEGAFGTNQRPPVCRTMWQWGTYTFYGGITSRPSFTIRVPGGIGYTEYDYYNTTSFYQNGIGSKRYTGTSTSGNATLTGIADTTGVAIGQKVLATDGGYAINSVVTGVTATTITLSTNATSSGSKFLDLYDVLEINGQQIQIAAVSNAIANLYNVGNCEVYISVPSYSGYLRTPYDGLSINILPAVGVQTLSVRATNGHLYSPPIPEITEPAQVIQPISTLNTIRWSKDNQPEHVPVGNEEFVGSGDVIAGEATKDFSAIFTTDGIYRLTGFGGDWAIDLLGSGYVLTAPQCVARMLDRMFAWTNRGLIEVTATGIVELSTGILNPFDLPTQQIEIEGSAFQITPRVRLRADERREELYLLFLGEATADPTVVICYSTRYQQFSTITFGNPRITEMVYLPLTATAGEDGYPVLCQFKGASKPELGKWDSKGAPLKPLILTQPVVGAEDDSDPWTSKRWYDITWIFDPVDEESTLIGIYNDVLGEYGTADAKNHRQDARLTLGIPRNAQVSGSLAVGIRANTAPSSVLRFRGFSIRYRDITQQPEKRQ